MKNQILNLIFIIIVFCIYSSFSIAMQNIHWKVVSDVPESKFKYPPQGLAIYNDTILFTNHWHNNKSMLYILDLNGKILHTINLPNNANHVSGLAYFKPLLFAANYSDGKIYVINLTYNKNKYAVKFIKTINTNLKGLSALAKMNYENKKYLLVTDFGLLAKTYILDLKKLLNTSQFDTSIIFSYNNKGFSQGIAYKNGKIYEACNRLFKDKIFIYDIDIQKNKINIRNSNPSFIYGPSNMIEDLDFYNNFLYTSDESTYKLYKLKINF